MSQKEWDRDLEEIIILISYPRSGNTFTRYILENLTGFASSGYGGSDSLSLINDDFSPGDTGLIVKRHGFLGGPDSLVPLCWVPGSTGVLVQEKHRQFPETTLINAFKDKRCKYILLLRNPIDSFYRHKGPRDNGHFGQRLEEWLDGQDNVHETYFKNISDFLFFKGKKLILTYEELVDNPYSYINKIHNFIDKPKITVGHFMDSYDHHFNEGRAFYSSRRMNQEMRSSGKDSAAYSKNVSKEMIEKIWLRIEDYCDRDSYKLLKDLYR